MKRMIAALLMLAALAIPVLAQDSADKITVLEGTLVMVLGSDGQTMVMLRQADKKLVALALPAGEIERLQLRERDKLKVSGVFVGSTAAEKTQERILAQTMIRNRKTLVVEDPIRLTEQDRLQVRAYEEDRLKIKAKDRVKAKAQTQAGSGSGSSGGGSGGSGSGSGGSGSGNK
jgi:uncharacterized membrane protein YgcG